MKDLIIADRTFTSRLFLGTGKFGSYTTMSQAIVAAQTQLVTLAMKRVDLHDTSDDLWQHVRMTGVHLLPNTSGVRTAQEAILAAQLAREAFGTTWVKLEVHPDPRHLLPDGLETLLATEALVQQGFTVLPYCPADPLLCKRLEEAGAAAVMPLAAPIGSNKGLQTLDFLRLIIAQAQVPVVIDAGLGAPSHAAQAMELGADACLVNTAIAIARDPISMAQAFAQAVQAGRSAYEAGLARPSTVATAVPTSPLTAFLA